MAGLGLPVKTYFKVTALSVLLLGLQILLSSCFFGNRISVPDISLPQNELDTSNLADHILAYCWSPTEKNNIGERATHIVVKSGDHTYETVLRMPPPANTAYMLGCLSQSEDDFSLGDFSITWRPQHTQLVVIGGTSPGATRYSTFEYTEDLEFSTSSTEDYSHRQHFQNPRGIHWDSAGNLFSTLGRDATPPPGKNIWLFSLEEGTGRRITKVVTIGEIVEHGIWSSDGNNLVIGLGEPISGIEIIDILSQSSLLQITSETHDLLKPWPHSIEDLFDIFSTLFISSYSQQRQRHLVLSSPPLVVNQAQQIVFIAPINQDHVGMLISDFSGSNLQKLLPNHIGLIGLLRLSPDEQEIAFVRYPNWDSVERAEIALLNLNTLEYKSLITVPINEEDDPLYISGLDWSPDGQYLAFGSNHGGTYDIYVISRDGNAWLNLTENREGDSVNPVWKP